jgi:hypothetical protein
MDVDLMVLVMKESWREEIRRKLDLGLGLRFINHSLG